MRRIVGKCASRWAAVAVAGVAGTLALTGCAQTRLGAAALYDNQRVSSATLAAQVANLNAGYLKYQGKVQVSYGPADMPRQVLSWILRFATANKMAASEGIVVSPAQAQRELQIETANVQQGGDTLAEAAVLNGLPPDMLSQLGTWISIQVQLERKLDNGVTPKTSSASSALEARVGHLQCLAAKNLNIKINPQYGVYNYAEFMVVAAPDTLSNSSPAPKATPSALSALTPKC